MSSSFKVIIAGGSLGGLMLALCLEAAGIDFVLLEKGEIGPQLGASIGFQPHSIKVFEQLGVWEDFKNTTVPIMYRQHFDENCKCFEDSRLFADIYEKMGRPWVFLERCEAIKILYNHVKDKSKVRAHTAIESYTESENGITVKTSTGETIEGSILVGSDGIHSHVRTLMADEVAKTEPDLAKEIKEGFTTEYKCLFGVSKNDPSKPMMPDGMIHTAYYDYHSSFSTAGVPGLLFWFFYVKMDKVSRMPNVPRFTDEDAAKVVTEYGKTVLGPGYTLQDLWDNRVRATLAPLEEGVSKKWSNGRVVLVGDAVHKATVNPGLGANTAYEGIVRLTNGLRTLLSLAPQPSVAQLKELFEATYEANHRGRAETVVSLSGVVTRYEAQDTWYLKMASRWVSPYIPDGRKADLYAAFSRAGPWLDFLPDPDAKAADGAQPVAVESRL
ncbi:putative fad binding domain protein [Lasiodiplodia theobromae]|uniref:FAD-dependent monooxygenase andE n=1 Tax=Lasiodiplodia theobromae TaxID=45133 RepID=A0A5N5DJD0_9PEZI|nr:Monooxygenase FAD-binding protein [Lasiodiplodia theobromae]KAB2577963.1 FAD-dependent monooxygenase andE [Lasiodiplodia theobromae]KAF4538033.1 Monooxygenase FAD-binding protein [Lasiodiplodia theobromae]KAF9638490.1 putative fad binding domain protein [Lasiodiplodia theobromae]